MVRSASSKEHLNQKPADQRYDPTRNAFSRRLRTLGRKRSRIFIAWTLETKAAAQVLCRHLSASGFSVWMSDHIQAGSRFREEIRRSIRSADLVIAVLPKEPSRWLTAEAGLAYFEEKLLPISIDEDVTVEPFNELQTHVLTSADIAAGDGSSVSTLVGLVEDRLGFTPDNMFIAVTIRLINASFFYGIPLFGLGVVSVALVLIVVMYLATEGATPPDLPLHLWRTGHTVLGAIVYGGACFIALVFAQASTTRSLAGRHFGFSTAQRLFVIWLGVAVVQFIVGLYLLDVSPYGRGDLWIYASSLLYMMALSLALVGFISHVNSYRLDGQARSFNSGDNWALTGNAAFSFALLLLTAVIVLMSLKTS
jgi:hypothetical protein